MALDTLYRPRKFDDVIGQSGAVKVLRQFVHTGMGFHQSYLFCGSHGSGKTTLGRILARALLCENPINGDPCDVCVSCKDILERGVSECFTEVDAATNSGKEDMRRIIESLQYDTFSGKRRIYLFDESHRLSRESVDALLKPMEDTVPGGEEKLLVCIFCTTEPEKMKATIFSRCAPAFVIRPVPPEGIADRLAWVCEQENISYERDALVCIAEVVECHIRDALKSVEGVSMMGTVNMENVKSYLRLNVNTQYLRLLAHIGKSLPIVLEEVEKLQNSVSPSTVYERVSELAMLAYRVGIGVGKPPTYWSIKHIQLLWSVHQAFLLHIAKMLSSKPGHPTYAMLECDLATLHFMREGGIALPAPTIVIPQLISAESAPKVEIQQVETVAVSANAGNIETVTPVLPLKGIPQAAPLVTRGGVYVNPKGINKRKEQSESSIEGAIPPLDPVEFRRGLHRLVAELTLNGRGTRSS